MIKGNIEIFQTYGDTSTSLFKSENMVVDGFRETIADIMTYMPNPSGTITNMELGASSVSSYQIQAMTLGSAKEGYSQRSSRFWFSSIQTSAANYQLLNPRKNTEFEMWDCFSGIGFNQWKYDNNVDANILNGPLLANGYVGLWHQMNQGAPGQGITDRWSILYNDTPPEFEFAGAVDGSIRNQEITTANGTESATRFELVKGQQTVTLRQRIPSMRLGGVYTAYSNGRAYNATMDFRVCRGQNGIPVEYYNFSSNTFVSLEKLDTNTQHTISLPEYLEVNKFRFRLQGNERDQVFLENDEYFVEYIFPSRGFTDKTFAPWSSSYHNPYIDILRLELCDERHQILQNPNFLDLQSIVLNNDFEITSQFTNLQAANPGAAEQEGLVQTPGWTQINPLALYSSDPQNASGALGEVRPFKEWYQKPNTVFSGATNGVLLHSSSTDTGASGCAALSQEFILGDRFKNRFAFADPHTPYPNLLHHANGQIDNNGTLMLAFDAMVSSTVAVANAGWLEVSLKRNSDGYFYNFSADATTLVNDTFLPAGTSKIFRFNAADTWEQKGVNIILNAAANREKYTLSIAARGRTDADGFANYGIKNFRLGALEGWRTYSIHTSGISNWSLSSSAARVTSGNLFSGLFLSSLSYDDLLAGGSAYQDIKNSMNGARNPKTQLVQNFVGMEPTKSYRLAVKGTRPTGSTPGLAYQLKAKARCDHQGNNYNILSTWMEDSAFNYSSVNRVAALNPYSNNGLAQRRTFPAFSVGLTNETVSPTDWGLYIDSSGNSTSSTGSPAYADNIRCNAGEYTLGCEVYNSSEHNSYFVLSATLESMGTTFFNWDNGEWDIFTGSQTQAGTLPTYRGDTSGSYFLNLPGGQNFGDFTKYKYPTQIPIRQSVFGVPSDAKTPDNLGSRGEYVIGAALFGPNAELGSCLVKNLALRGPGLRTNVDIWKELYYDFVGGTWQPTPVSGASDYYSEEVDAVPESFLSTPQRLVTNMWAYGLDRDTEFQLNIIDTSGGQTVFHDVTLTDVSLVANEGSSRWIRDAETWTSEPYNNSRYREYDNGAVFKLWNEGIITPTAAADPSSMSNWNVPGGVLFNYTSGNMVSGPSTDAYIPTMRIQNQQNSSFWGWLTQSFTLSEGGLNAGDEFAIGLEAMAYNNTQQIVGGIEAMYGGKTYTYNTDSREWNLGSGRARQIWSIKTYGSLDADAWLNDASTWAQLLSPVIVAPRFGPETKIVISFQTDPNNSNLRNIDLKNFKVYGHTNASSNEYRVSGATFNFPEFPQPEDRTLQPPQASGTPGQLGHFLNHINYFDYTVAPKRSYGEVSAIRETNNPMAPSPTGDTTLEQAVTMGAYLPSAGLFFYSGTYGLLNSQQNWDPYDSSAGLVKGTLNTMGVVNSDGYIYRHPTWASVTNMHDASAGFLVSSVSSTIGASYAGYGKKTLRYILKVHRDDWRFLDYYMGGLGAIGLHTINYKKSYEKLGTAYQISGTGNTYSQGTRTSLYNVSRPSRNPVFNLANKKVMFPPGLKIDYHNMDYVTIIWDINY